MAWSDCELNSRTVCYWFDKTSNPADWPGKIQVNALSSTGYSWGTLAVTDDNKDGFELPDLVWVIKDKNSGVVTWMEDTEFKKKYSLL